MQELTTFFKNLENDTQFDQLIGAIPAQFSIPYGNWCVPPSASSDMDNNVGFSNPVYASETFTLIVGTNPSRTEIYTFEFTYASMASSNTDSAVFYPFRMQYQQNRSAGQSWTSQTAGAIGSSKPMCAIRPSSFVANVANSATFPLMYEPITLEINR